MSVRKSFRNLFNGNKNVLNSRNRKIVTLPQGIVAIFLIMSIIIFGEMISPESGSKTETGKVLRL